MEQESKIIEPSKGLFLPPGVKPDKPVVILGADGQPARKAIITSSPVLKEALEKKFGGEVVVFENDEDFEKEQARRKAAGEPPLLELGKKPKRNCRKCYGRGFLGRDFQTKQLIPCSCTKPKR